MWRNRDIEVKHDETPGIFSWIRLIDGWICLIYNHNYFKTLIFVGIVAEFRAQTWQNFLVNINNVTKRRLCPYTKLKCMITFRPTKLTTCIVLFAHHTRVSLRRSAVSVVFRSLVLAYKSRGVDIHFHLSAHRRGTVCDTVTSVLGISLQDIQIFFPFSVTLTQMQTQKFQNYRKDRGSMTTMKHIGLSCFVR